MRRLTSSPASLRDVVAEIGVRAEIGDLPKSNRFRRNPALDKGGCGSRMQGDAMKKRLCKKCNKRSCMPSRSAYICSCCFHRQEKKRRLHRWDAGERPKCQNHPKRNANRCVWVHVGRRLCATCWSRLPSNRVGDLEAKRKYAKRL